MGNSFPGVQKTLTEEHARVLAMSNSKRKYLVLDQLSEMELSKTQAIRDHWVDFTHIGTLAVLDKRKNGRFTLKDLLELAELCRKKETSYGSGTDFEMKFRGYCTLRMWHDMSRTGGVERFVLWFCTLFLQVSKSSLRRTDDKSRQVYINDAAVKTLHTILQIDTTYGMDFQNFLELMQEVGEEKGEYSPDDKRHEWMVPISVLEQFSRYFAVGFLNLMETLGFDPPPATRKEFEETAAASSVLSSDDAACSSKSDDADTLPSVAAPLPGSAASLPASTSVDSVIHTTIHTTSSGMNNPSSKAATTTTAAVSSAPEVEAAASAASTPRSKFSRAGSRGSGLFKGARSKSKKKLRKDALRQQAEGAESTEGHSGGSGIVHKGGGAESAGETELSAPGSNPGSTIGGVRGDRDGSAANNEDAVADESADTPATCARDAENAASPDTSSKDAATSTNHLTEENGKKGSRKERKPLSKSKSKNHSSSGSRSSSQLSIRRRKCKEKE
mmetsp:Transcript_43094/g.108847  ORF Transcript_43094/g.108847 Transcript_43094/m.108847 type:complete len:502 (-) Transcript_43094:78-1583(-)|eukprot:CAMPEP_0177640452 /NCGR_PEP_ID=MMETSP0447-20121125/6550_1 /TAXON_ID=0 /ORGANISM="Stygamoeba regulata, Strain BSH-02190019" /LENGTH=501 /DNA_ID=CAMNT_0019142523 /DNA_START=253 /DNA_END=1758 /DNA_ORIENTATION=-